MKSRVVRVGWGRKVRMGGREQGRFGAFGAGFLGGVSTRGTGEAVEVVQSSSAARRLSAGWRKKENRKGWTRRKITSGRMMLSRRPSWAAVRHCAQAELRRAFNFPLPHLPPRPLFLDTSCRRSKKAHLSSTSLQNAFGTYSTSQPPLAYIGLRVGESRG